ncbi:MAG: class I SAM-dependent methyltransferase [Thermodesulfovibrionales bacterium]
MKCKICTAETAFFAREKILQKQVISYFKCDHCGFIQTEEPCWLKESYSHAINRSDVGLVTRNLSLAKITKCLIFTLFDKNARFIDYGSGYGLLVRLMRDSGLDFYYYDKFCENILSPGFEADTSCKTRYELLTAFEVFEHLVNPLEEIENMFSFSQDILFTTELLPINNPGPSEWWYYGLEHGQHISFYNLKTLKVIAQIYNMNVYSAGSVHLLSKRKINKHLFTFLTKNYITNIISPLMIKKSLLQSDFIAFKSKLGRT